MLFSAFCTYFLLDEEALENQSKPIVHVAALTLSFNSQYVAGGCHGNGNKFETMEFCQAACKRSGPGVASYRGKKKPGPQGSLVNICNLPRDVGKCGLNQSR